MSTPTRHVALVDCESFYASCEVVFDPKLVGRPIGVLSNNDGCIVAPNTLLKRMNPKIMGKPLFQIEAWCRLNGVVLRSSNYELYGSLSARVMEVIGRHSAWQEVYSIDESFIGLRGAVPELIAAGRRIRADVMRATGIPVRVAIARTKTLAKVAALGIKKEPRMKGVSHLGAYSPAQVDRFLDSIPVTDLWGVASCTGKKLAPTHIFTARELRDAEPKVIRKKFSVVMERTAEEVVESATPEPAALESYLPSREDIEIQAGLDDETFAQTFIERRDNWANEGNEDALLNRASEANLSWPEFIPIVASENASVYAPALFRNDWAQNPEVSAYVDRMTESNRGVMGNYVITAWNTENPANIEGYWLKREVTSVERISGEGGQRTLEIAFNNIDNNSKNSIDPYLSPGGILTVTSIVSGDVELITSVSGHETF